MTTPTPLDPAHLASLAARIAAEAGSLLRERAAQAPRGVESKSTRSDLVSDADRDSEGLIARMLHSERPGDGFLGEETGASSGSTGVRWVVDPLDGTVNFLRGIPQWCVSIACDDDQGNGIAAAIYDPSRDEMFSAFRGGGATLNGDPIRCSAATEVARAVIATGFAYDEAERAEWGRVIASILPRIADVRRGGSAALDLAWTACGRVDAYAEIPCRPWDRAAGLLIAAESGCRFTLLPELGPSGTGVLAAPPALYEQVAAMLRNAGIPA